VHTYRSSGSRAEADRAELFCARVSDYRATVVRTPSEGLRLAIAEAAVGLRVVVSAEFPRRLWPADVVVDAQLPVSELASADGSLTTATVAIAETGTIVLSGAPSEGRRAMTLIPDTHICVVAASQVVETVPEAFVQLSAPAREGRPLTFISGPSATSDIELERVEGVHGPRQLVVIVYGSPPAAR
jgi:L-lactate dehydrogenase complex protein LldG